MEKKREDRRVRYTKHLISQALFKLLEEKNLEDISVTELCFLADVNRGTFYKYYSDVPDLFQHMEDEVYEELKQILDTCLFKDMYSMYRQLMDVLRENKDMISILLQKGPRASYLVSRLVEYSWQRLLDHQAAALSPEYIEKSEYIFSYQYGGTVEVLIRWIRTGMETDPEFICGIIHDINQLIENRFEHHIPVNVTR